MHPPHAHVSSTKYFYQQMRRIRIPHHGPCWPATSFMVMITSRKTGKWIRTCQTTNNNETKKDQHRKGVSPRHQHTLPPGSTERVTSQWTLPPLLFAAARVATAKTTRANAGHRLLRDAPRPHVARRRWRPTRRPPVSVSPTPQSALSVEARRRDCLLLQNSLKVLSKALVVGLTVNGVLGFENCTTQLQPQYRCEWS